MSSNSAVGQSMLNLLWVGLGSQFWLKNLHTKANSSSATTSLPFSGCYYQVFHSYSSFTCTEHSFLVYSKNDNVSTCVCLWGRWTLATFLKSHKSILSGPKAGCQTAGFFMCMPWPTWSLLHRWQKCYGPPLVCKEPFWFPCCRLTMFIATLAACYRVKASPKLCIHIHCVRWNIYSLF